MLSERALVTKMRQLHPELVDRAVADEPTFETLLAVYAANATSDILNENRRAHAARIDTIHEELGQRFAAISLAVSAIKAGGEIADAVALIKMAVEEARRELKLHRYEARQEILP